MIDLCEMSKESANITAKRFNLDDMSANNKTFLTLKHCAGEVVEAMEAYGRSDADFAEELGDIIMCCLTCAGINKIDIEYSLIACQEKNAARAKGGNDNGN